MIRINLIGVQEVAQSAERRRQLRIAYAVAGGNIVAMVLFSLIVSGLAASRRSAMAETKAQIQSVLKVAHDVEGEERQRAVLEEKRRVIADLERREVGPFRILEALSDATPTRLWLTEFADKNGEVTITGLAIDDPTVADFLARLQQSPHFHGLELVETAQTEEGRMRVKKFVMRGPLSYSGNGNGNGNGTGDGMAEKALPDGKRS